MSELGGRSPYEVVTGIKPKLPVAMVTEGPREFVPVDEYVRRLQQYMEETYRSVRRTKEESVERHEGTLEGRMSAELLVGDAVLVRRDPTEKRAGPERFQSRVYPGVYKVSRKVGPHTFHVQDFADPEARVTFSQPVNAERLVRLDLPELELNPEQPRDVEIFRGDAWERHRIDKFSADGRVYVVQSGLEPGSRGVWMDLSKQRFRYVS